jgi:hypothetical protein
MQPAAVACSAWRSTATEPTSLKLALLNAGADDRRARPQTPVTFLTNGTRLSELFDALPIAHCSVQFECMMNVVFADHTGRSGYEPERPF